MTPQLPKTVRNDQFGNIEMKSRPARLKRWIAYISNRVRDTRVRKSITQKALAKYAGIPLEYLRRLEAQELSPSYIAVSKIARGLNVRRDRLDEGPEAWEAK